VQALLREAELNHVKLDATTLEFTMRKRLEEQAAVFQEKPDDLEALKRLHGLLNISDGLPFPVGLATVQELSFARLAYQAMNGSSNALAAAAGNGHGNGDSATTQQPSEAALQDWSRELSAVREKLSIQGRP
jgi:hypothetical protein